MADRTPAVGGRLASDRDNPHDPLGRECRRRSTAWQAAQTGRHQVSESFIVHFGSFSRLEFGNRINPTMAPLAHNNPIHLVPAGQGVIADAIRHCQPEQRPHDQTVFSAALPGAFFDDLS